MNYVMNKDEREKNKKIVQNHVTPVIYMLHFNRLRINMFLNHNGLPIIIHIFCPQSVNIVFHWNISEREARALELMRSKVLVPKNCLTTMNTHVKYRNTIITHSKVIAKVKVVADKRRDQKLYAPNLRLQSIKIHFTLLYLFTRFLFHFYKE